MDRFEVNPPLVARAAHLINGQKKEINLDNSRIIVIKPNQGKRISVSGLLGEHYNRQTDFGDAVVDFGDHFSPMKWSVVPEEKRLGINQDLPPQVTLIPNDQAMDQMTIIANTPGAYTDPNLKKEYRASLTTVMEGIKKNGELNPQAVRVAIKRAGVVAAEMLHGKDSALVFEAKRLPFENGDLGVGIEDEDQVLTPENLHQKELEIDEVFLASGSTLIALMLELNLGGIEPKSLTIVAPFATQQGIEAVLEISKLLGWQTKIVTSRIYYSLDNNLYVLVTPEEKVWKKVTKGNPEILVQAGGDAGDLTEVEE